MFYYIISSDYDRRRVDELLRLELRDHTELFVMTCEHVKKKVAKQGTYGNIDS